MTRNQLIEMVEDRLVKYHAGVDTTEMFTPQMIGIHLELAYSTVLNQIIQKQQMQNGSSDLNSYATTYKDLEIKEDEVRGEKYIQLPVKPIDIMHNEAIRLVAPNKDKKSFFFSRIEGGQNVLMQCLDVNNRQDGVYYLDGEKIYFERINEDLETMQVVMIPSLQAQEDDVDITLPREGGTAVVDTCYNMLIAKYNLPADNVNDQTIV